MAANWPKMDQFRNILTTFKVKSRVFLQYCIETRKNLKRELLSAVYGACLKLKVRVQSVKLVLFQSTYLIKLGKIF